MIYTTLAQQEIERGSTALSSCTQSDLYTTLVWDNNDFGEETLSGKGTTHNTNGIAIQHTESQPFTQTVPLLPKKKTKQRSLLAPDKDIVPFRGDNKSSPELFATIVDLELGHHLVSLQHHKDKNTAYYLTEHATEHFMHSWTGFNQPLTTKIPPRATIGYLPVLDASPTELNTVNTILHRSVEIANQLELPSVAVVVDQAIYAKAQTIWWQTPVFKDRVVLRLGAFHTTMTALACIGKRFRDAGLQDILIESDIVAVGSVNGVMNGHHYNRSIRCHKFMAEALHVLHWDSFLEIVSEEAAEKYGEMVKCLYSSFPSQQYTDLLKGSSFQGMVKAYDTFIQDRSNNVTFAIWISYLEMVEDVLLFIRATRDGNWSLHLAAVRALLPWMFAYDRTNYSRYLPVYWFEMNNLATTNPFVHQELVKGDFAVQRQDVHGFSRVACDMTIEQTANRDSKTRGGMKGFTTSIKEPVTDGLELIMNEQLLRGSEEMAGKGQRVAIRKDLTNSRMTKDTIDVHNIISTISNMTNPFDNDPEVGAGDLVHLSSGVIASPELTDLITAHKKGDDEFIAFSRECLQGEVDLNETLKKQKLKKFSDASKPKTVVLKGNTVNVKSDRELLARLVVIDRVRNIDHRHMLSYCFGQFPLSVATCEGCLIKTNKAKLLHVLEAGPDVSPVVEIPRGSVWIIDGMAMLQQMSPKNMPQNMCQLAEKILKQLVYLASINGSTAIHFVTDRYPEVSIKNAERKHRAESGSKKINISKPDQPIPKQWKKYLAHSYNKENLVKFLFETWKKLDAAVLKGITVLLAHGEQCHSIKPLNGIVNVQELAQLSNCTHKEADTRMFMHASYIANTCDNSFVIKSPDTDVFVIGIALESSIGSSRLYFHTGRGENVRTIHLHAIKQQLGDAVTNALIDLHASLVVIPSVHFTAKARPSHLNLYGKIQHFFSAFQLLGESFTVSEEMVTALGAFVCSLYGQQDCN